MQQLQSKGCDTNCKTNVLVEERANSLLLSLAKSVCSMGLEAQLLDPVELQYITNKCFLKAGEARMDIVDFAMLLEETFRRHNIVTIDGYKFARKQAAILSADKKTLSQWFYVFSVNRTNSEQSAEADDQKPQAA